MRNNVPEDVLSEIILAEAIRLSMTPEEIKQQIPEKSIWYMEDYISDCVGYSGPIVVIMWGAGPEAVSTFYKPRFNGSKWIHCNSTSW